MRSLIKQPSFIDDVQHFSDLIADLTIATQWDNGLFD